ncbi:MAG TPA: hypothetical protein PLH57_02865 [Oligoflexia bacterium]|nr:hypothetical protein [Oligoflexia bacterium]
MERRAFFQELVERAGKTGMFARFFSNEKTIDQAALEARLMRDEDYYESVKSRFVMRSGEAVTLNGEPFGRWVSDLVVMERPDPMGETENSSLVIVCGHEHEGLSVFEWSRGQHAISSYVNARISEKTPVAVWDDKSEELGAFGITHIVYEPKSLNEPGYVHALERDGHVIELNPHTGVFFRRRNLSFHLAAIPWLRWPNGDKCLVRVTESKKFAVVAFVNADGQSFVSVVT